MQKVGNTSRILSVYTKVSENCSYQAWLVACACKEAHFGPDKAFEIQEFVKMKDAHSIFIQI
jgi:hypothetical protein